MSISRKQFTFSAVFALVAFTGGSYLLLHENADAKNTALSAEQALAQVEVSHVIEREIIDWQEFSGRLEAIDHVEVRPQISGKIIRVHFKEGGLVQKGDLLFSIDARPYEAELQRAKAQYAAAEAKHHYAQSNLARNRRLISNNAIAHHELEFTENEARSASAHMQAAKADVDAAQIHLEYTRITAPVSGKISRANVTVGNVISSGAGAPVLTSIVSISPLYASFDIDEQTYLKYLSQQKNTAKIPVHMGLSNESGFSHQGAIHSIDNNLNTSSGTIKVRAIFKNDNGALLPGLFSRIRLGGGEPRSAILIAPTAIGVDQDKRFVIVVNDKNQTAYREVQLGAEQAGLQIIQSGLTAQDLIVVNGLQRIRPGDAIAPQMIDMPDPQSKSQDLTVKMSSESAASASL